MVSMLLQELKILTILFKTLNSDCSALSDSTEIYSLNFKPMKMYSMCLLIRGGHSELEELFIE